MKICRKTLLSILLCLMVVCFALTAVFDLSLKNNQVLADNSVKYEFTQATDGDKFASAPDSGGNWAISDGVLKPLGSWYVTFLKVPVDLTKDFTISLDFCLGSSETQFNVAIAQSATDMKNNAMGLSFRDGSTVWTCNVLGYGWQGENASDGYRDGDVHTLTLKVSRKALSFEIDQTAFVAGSGVGTLNLTESTGYLVLQATDVNTYVDDIVVSEATEPSNEIASADFEASTDADKFGSNGNPWVISDGKFYSNADWGTTYLNTALDLTKEQTVTFDLYLKNQGDATDGVKKFWLGFADSTTFTNFNGLMIVKNDSSSSVWFNNKFGAEGWVGEDNTIDLFDETVHAITINVVDGKMSFKIDGVPFVCLTSISTMNVPADTGYFCMQATNGACYIDNFKVTEPKPDDGVIDFEVETDSDLFTALGTVNWKISNGKYYPEQESDINANSAIKLNQAIDLTTNKVISFDFAMDKYNFDISLLDVNASNMWGTSLTLHLKAYQTTGLANLNTNIDDNGIGHISDYVLDTAYTDGVVRNMKIKVEQGTVTYFIDGVQVATADKPADSVYLVLRACGTATYVDNLKVVEPKDLIVKNIAGTELDTLSVMDTIKLPARTDVGFIGYNVGGKLYPAGYEIDTTGLTEIVAVTVNLSTADSAYIRTDPPAGLRFKSSIDCVSKNYLDGLSVDYTLTTIIVKASDVSVSDVVDLTAIKLDGEYTKLAIKSTVGEVVSGNYCFYGALVEIKESHYAWAFAARACITVTYEDGTSATIYGTGGTSRSVSEVARAVIESEESNPSGDLDEQELDIIRGFIVPNNTVYLSVNGNDDNDGTSFGSAVVSPSRAMELVTDSRNIVYVGEGEYFLDQTLVVNKNVTFQSMYKDGAVFSGATKIDNSSVVEVNDPVLGRVWEIPYSNKATQLYIDDTHATRARYPDAGQELRLLFADLTLRTLTIDKDDLGDFSSSDILNAVMVPTIAWSDAYLTVKSVNNTTVSGYQAYQLKFAPADSAFFERSIVIHPRASYHFENSKAFLSVAGEWFCDEIADKIYYIPYADQTLDNVVIRVPSTENLVSVCGTEQEKLSAVTFNGITFAYTANDVDGKIGGQANLDYAYSSNHAGINANRPTSALSVEFVDNFIFQNNTIKYTANGGLDLVQGVSNSSVNANRFMAIGGNGILAGATNSNATLVESTLVNQNYQIKGVAVENNYLSDIAWQEYGGVGIIFTYAVDCKITKNDIRGGAYSGISVGWGWQTMQSSKNFLGNIEISYNRITNICNLLNDGGAIYLSGCQQGTKVINNYIANVYNYVYHYPVDKKTDYNMTGGGYSYSQIWWANAGVYLDTAAGSDDSNNPIIVSGNYIASDIENQRYEFNNVNSSMPTGQELYFTIDGNTLANLKAMVNPINYDNGASAVLYESTGVTDTSLIPSSPVLFGSHTVDTSTVTVYGLNLGDQDVYLDGQKITSFTERTDTFVTFTTTGFSNGGHTVRVGNSNVAITIGVDFTYDSITRFADKFGADFYNTLRYDNVVEKQEISTQASDFTSSTYISGYSPELICDGEVSTGWSMTMDDAPGYVSFKLKTASTIDKFILYARIGAGNDVVSRSNFTITGITSDSQRVPLFTTTGEAYDEYGMLIVDVEQTEYKDTVFSGFELKKNDNGYFFVAEIAII